MLHYAAFLSLYPLAPCLLLFLPSLNRVHIIELNMKRI